jgi:hypothetical protein
MNFEAVYRLCADISGFSVAIPIISLLMQIRRLNLVSKILLGYLFISLLTEISFSFVVDNKKESTYWIEVIFYGIEFALITLIYFATRFYGGKRLVFFLMPVGFAIIIYFIALSRGSLDLFRSVYAGVIVALSSDFYLRFYQLNLSEDESISSNYFFWYNSGFLYFFSSSLALYVFRDFIVSGGLTVNRALWIFQLLNNTVMYGFFTVGIWKLKKK